MGVLKLENDPGIIEILDNDMRNVNDDNHNIDAKKPKKKKLHNIVHDRATPTKRKLGVRQARRSENLNNLLVWLEGQDDGFDCEALDVVEPSTSVFSELFSEQEKMKLYFYNMYKVSETSKTTNDAE